MLRGLVIIIMALDHTRDFVHNGALTIDVGGKPKGFDVEIADLIARGLGRTE